MEILWAALGGIGGAGLLVWSIFAFVVEKRDREHREEKQRFYKDLYDFEDRLGSDLKFLRQCLDKAIHEIQLLRVSNEKQSERLLALHDKFHDYVVRVDKILEKQDAKLDLALGKIISVGKK